MNFDDTIHTAARINAVHAPARLERVRQRRDASPGAPHRSRLAWQAGAGLHRAGAWLQGVPATIPSIVPAIVPVIADALEVPPVEPSKVVRRMARWPATIP